MFEVFKYSNIEINDVDIVKLYIFCLQKQFYAEYKDERFTVFTGINENEN